MVLCAAHKKLCITTCFEKHISAKKSPMACPNGNLLESAETLLNSSPQGISEHDRETTKKLVLAGLADNREHRSSFKYDVDGSALKKVQKVIQQEYQKIQDDIDVERRVFQALASDIRRELDQNSFMAVMTMEEKRVRDQQVAKRICQLEGFEKSMAEREARFAKKVDKIETWLAECDRVLDL